MDRQVGERIAETAPASTTLRSTPFDTPAPRGRRSRLGLELALLGIVGVALIAALWAGGAALYAQFYSPSAFVARYLGMLSDGRAAEALTVPGVAVDSVALEEAGLPAAASEALLRRAALAELRDIEIVSETAGDGVTLVTATYSAGPYPGRTTFRVAGNGWIGVVPAWRFAESPLAVVNLTVRGAMQFTVNGFEVDKRQVSADGADADPLAPVPLLVFSPGVYSVSVDTAMSETPGVAVLSDAPAAGIPVDIQAQPTEQFVTVVQEQVDAFLADCAAQQVLQPTGCPFGLTVRNRILAPPVWSIVEPPAVRIEPDGAGWRIPPTDAVAHIDVDIRLLFDGSVTHVSEDVRFTLAAQIGVLSDGSASIRVSGENAE